MENVHSVHHESFNPNPFSGLSMHPLEGAAYYSALPAYVALRAATGVPMSRFAVRTAHMGALPGV